MWDLKEKLFAVMSTSEKSEVDRAMGYANKGDFDNAVRSYVSDRAKTGDTNPLNEHILRDYCGNLEKFLEGLLGFYQPRYPRKFARPRILC